MHVAPINRSIALSYAHSLPLSSDGYRIITRDQMRDLTNAMHVAHLAACGIISDCYVHGDNSDGMPDVLHIKLNA